MAALSGLTSVTIGNVPPGNPPSYGNAESNRQGFVNDKYKEYSFKLTFGDGSLTYPASGIPLSTTGVQGTTIPGTTSTYGTGELASAVSFGFRSSLKILDLYDVSNGDGYVYKIDKTNLKLRIYQVPATGSLGSAAALVEVTTGFAPASGVTLYGHAKGR